MIMRARESFDQDLKRLKLELKMMSRLVESAVHQALVALEKRDLELSDRVVAADDRIDQKEREIAEACITLMRREAPVAGDLRQVIASLMTAGELERIGDYAEGIAKISVAMGEDEFLVEKPTDIPVMVDIATDMLKCSIQAYLQDDPSKVESIAASIGPEEEKVDSLHRKVNEGLIELMKIDPKKTLNCIHFQWISHNIERIADRATNIAERAVYRSTGRTVRIHPKGYLEDK